MKDQLNHGLESDRRHQALVMLGGVDMPGSEEDGEQRHECRDPQRRVPQQRQERSGDRGISYLGIIQQHDEARGDRLQL